MKKTIMKLGKTEQNKLQRRKRAQEEADEAFFFMISNPIKA